MTNGLNTTRKAFGATVFLLLIITLLYNAIFSFSYSFDPNYRNVSIDTRVNITNAGPQIQAVTLPAAITLNAGSTTTVQCNVSVLDYNGASDINFTNATFYHSTSSSGAADDNNTHYTNTSCTVTGASGNIKNFTCAFEVLYYALNGTWTCNATTQDNSTYNDSLTNTTSVNQLLALNVTQTLLDYGNMAVGDTSSNRTLNVTNIGNVQINVSVKGYGAALNDGLSFDCNQGNITVGAQKWSTSIADDYAAKTALSASFDDTGLQVLKQNTPGSPPENTTYWQLYVPPNPFGECNGTIVFQAENS